MSKVAHEYSESYKRTKTLLYCCFKPASLRSKKVAHDPLNLWNKSIIISNSSSTLMGHNIIISRSSHLHVEKQDRSSGSTIFLLVIQAQGNHQGNVQLSQILSFSWLQPDLPLPSSFIYHCWGNIYTLVLFLPESLKPTGRGWGHLAGNYRRRIG